LEQVLRVLPAGIVVLDGAGRVQQCNPAAVQLLQEPLQGLLWRDIIKRAFDPRLDDGHEVSSRDGRRISVSTQPLGTEPGQVILLKDNTETRLLQDRLNHHKRLSALGEMAASLAHQIRTPLAAGLLYASHLAKGDLPAAEQRRFAEKIVDRLRHLERLLRNILLFAKGGRVGEDLVPIHSLLNQTQQAVEAQLRSSEASLDLLHDGENASIQGNREMLVAAVQNLVTNALQACGEGAQLQLVVRRSGEDAVDLILVDNGPGIPPELHDRIFEPFFTTRTQGTGLGLAVVKAIARAHRGAVWVDSPPGGGCAFTLRLPKAVSDGSAMDVMERSLAHGSRSPL
jgi:two-component system sensor histidine kinase FlrB